MLDLTRTFGFALKHETRHCHCLCFKPNFKSSSHSFPPLLEWVRDLSRRTWQSTIPSAPECTGTRFKAVQQQNLEFLHSSVLWFWNPSIIKSTGLWQMCSGISSLRYTCLILPVSTASRSVSAVPEEGSLQNSQWTWVWAQRPVHTALAKKSS